MQQHRLRHAHAHLARAGLRRTLATGPSMKARKEKSAASAPARCRAATTWNAVFHTCGGRCGERAAGEPFAQVESTATGGPR